MQTIETIYENGVFRPLGAASLPFVEGDRVLVTVDAPSSETAADVLALAADVYSGLSDDEIREIERVAFDRTSFFSPRNKSNEGTSP